jgi:anaerobic ribonucleoside-triphosphate reductase
MSIVNNQPSNYFRPTHIVKNNLPPQVGISGINASLTSCDKCGVFHPKAMMLPTKRGLFKNICYHCGSEKPYLLSEPSKLKLNKLKKGA